MLQNHCGWWLQPWNYKKLAPWKKSYDKPTKCIKKQRHYFPNKSPSSQSYGFSSSHVWMGDMSHKEGWASKNRCFETVVLEKTLESPVDCKVIQHHSSKASILQCSAFFMTQLSHPYMTTGKTIALTLQTFVGKVMTLLFNMLLRLVITFLRRSKQLLIFWLQSPSAVILEHKKIKSVTVSVVSPSICHEVMGPAVGVPRHLCRGGKARN